MSKAYRDLIIRESIDDSFFYLGEPMTEIIKIPDVDNQGEEFIIEIAEDVGDVVLPFIESNLEKFGLEYNDVIGEDDLFDIISDVVLSELKAPSKKAINRYGTRGATKLMKASAKAGTLARSARTMGTLSGKMSSFGDRRIAAAKELSSSGKDWAGAGGAVGYGKAAWRGTKAAAHAGAGLAAKIGAGMATARQGYLRGAARRTMASGFGAATQQKRYQDLRDKEAAQRAERLRQAGMG
jgi:hypothetical protein